MSALKAWAEPKAVELLGASVVEVQAPTLKAKAKARALSLRRWVKDDTATTHDLFNYYCRPQAKLTDVPS